MKLDRVDRPAGRSVRPIRSKLLEVWGAYERRESGSSRENPLEVELDLFPMCEGGNLAEICCQPLANAYRVAQIAGLAGERFAMAWVLAQPGVNCPVVGASGATRPSEVLRVGETNRRLRNNRLLN